MTKSGYSENALVEQPAIALLNSLGWETYNAYHEFDHLGGNPLGRETKSEVALVKRLRPAMERLNPDLPANSFDQAIEELTRDRSRMSLAAANQEIYDLIKNGVRVKVPDPEGEGEMVEVVRLVDWNEPDNNDFLLCSQLWVTGEMYTRRTDLVGFINGLPLVFIELKASHKNVKDAFNHNLSDYKDTIPHLFWYNALVILSNGSESKIGSVTAGWEHFADWKKIGSEEEEGVISLETMLRGTCEPPRLLDLVENFTLFMEAPGGLIKILAKNHQYLGVNNALDALHEIENREGRLGVFWHTQGSGKSISMIFFSQKVLRKVPGNWTFVVVTDRQELDTQIYRNFASSGVITESKAQATSSRNLRQLLGEDHRYVFTLIHKFRTEPGEVHPVCSERSDIIVITDEAHRSQYDTLALNMRNALPNASFLAFTGTPLIVGEEKTREVFGDYISIYDFKQSVDDDATVPLYYENRIPELQLTNENLNKQMEQLLEEAELDEAQEQKLEREFAREYHLITREDRLEAVAEDLVEHFTGRGFAGKGMVVCIDKATAVKMYDRVQKYWKRKMRHLHNTLAAAVKREESELEAQLEFMEKTDMAVVVSPSQNEIAEMEAKGLDIRPHRKRINDEDMESKFRDPDDPFRLVFVCAMWMTGFDVPSCSTIYLDKPMRNHTLMQTIARANRVFPEKNNGLIVDYVGVFRNLEKALAIYGRGGSLVGPGDRPVQDKSELVRALRAAITEIEEFCQQNGVDLVAIGEAEGFDRVKLLDDAVDALLKDDATKKRYISLASDVSRLFKAILPDPLGNEFAPTYTLVGVIVQKIRSLTPPVDISGVMESVGELLDASIASKGYVIRDPLGEYGDHRIDLSRIDFEVLKKKFDTGRKRTEAEKLKSAISRKLSQLIRANKTRIDFLERFQRLIEEYNQGSINVELFFEQLLELAKKLGKEEKRGVSEQLSEEELAVFDILTKPRMELTAKDISRVKKTARDLLDNLKREKLVLDWRKRQATRAAVRVSIEETLDEGLPTTYSKDLFQQKSQAVFQHVFESYYGASKSLYATMPPVS